MVDLASGLLLFSFILAGYATWAAFMGGRWRNDQMIASAERSAVTLFVLSSLMMAALVFAFVTRDFSLEYVAQYSNRTLPMFYTISAVWAGQSGSLLLWAWLLSLFAAIVVWQNRRKSGKNYSRYQAANLDQGSVLSLTITNLPAAPRDYRWLAPVILLLLIATGYAMNRWRKSRTIDERRLLIEQILQLDENFEFGKIDASSYQSKCLKLVQKVLALEDEGANDSGNEITENTRRNSDEIK